MQGAAGVVGSSAAQEAGASANMQYCLAECECSKPLMKRTRGGGQLGGADGGFGGALQPQPPHLLEALEQKRRLQVAAWNAPAAP